jgi:hypothetical protein
MVESGDDASLVASLPPPLLVFDAGTATAAATGGEGIDIVGTVAVCTVGAEAWTDLFVGNTVLLTLIISIVCKAYRHAAVLGRHPHSFGSVDRQSREHM